MFDVRNPREGGLEELNNNAQEISDLRAWLAGDDAPSKTLSSPTEISAVTV
jgi:hypothetical protein